MPMESRAQQDRGGYVLGHADRELQRLGTQARLIDPITRRFLLAAGLTPRMRVLDVGSGAGDVTFLAAAIVGAGGSVIGVDRSADAIATASAAAAARGLTNVRFLPGDLSALALVERFDAIIGRYVLQWLPDPAAILRTLARYVEPGGVIVFHEPDWAMAASYPPAPLFDATCRWVAETIRRSGAETHGATMFGTFERAGLGPPSMRLEAVVGAGPDAEPIDLVADLALTVAPTAETYGIASIGELDPDTLHARLHAEAVATGSVLVARGEIGAWVRR
jgi:SAM-dependent methyltransferase